MVVNKIMIKNTTTGQSDSADIGASAENISFDPTGSNLESTDAESAIKETYGAIPANTSQLINDSNFVASSSLADVATSGDYEDLSNTPSLAIVATSGSYSDLSNKPVLATVATSGSYNDLSNTPTIPSIEANPSDTATNTLTKLEVDGTIYNVASGSGGSTVAWNQIQTSTGGTKIAEISIDGDSTDIYAPSGGSGSSTLSGLSDVSLTSPSDGQVLKYDATNQEWINGTSGGGNADIVHLTQAQYDALPSSKLSDDKIYMIEDVTSKEVEGEHYSTNEQIVGEWIDGSPIYQITEVLNSVITINSSANASFQPSWFSSVDMFISCMLYRRDEDSQYGAACHPAFARKNTDTNKLNLYSAQEFRDCKIITFQYTKTSS